METGCKCTRRGGPCTPCLKGYHIFCNYLPHGNMQQAVDWFADNPEALDHVIPRDEIGREVAEEARRVLQDKEK